MSKHKKKHVDLRPFILLGVAALIVIALATFGG